MESVISCLYISNDVDICLDDNIVGQWRLELLYNGCEMYKIQEPMNRMCNYVIRYVNKHMQRANNNDLIC